MEILHSFCIC